MLVTVAFDIRIMGGENALSLPKNNASLCSMRSFIGFEPSKPSKALSKFMFVSDGTRYVRYELLISSVAALVVFMDSWRGVGSPGVVRGLGTVMRIDMADQRAKGEE